LASLLKKAVLDDMMDLEMSSNVNKLLGKGLYSPAEAARYARVTTGTVNRWLFGNASGDAVLRSELGVSIRCVTFLDLLQIMAVRAIRAERSLPLQRIRDSVRRAEDDYNVSFPLARRHTTYLVNGNLTIRVGSDLIQVSGRDAHSLHLSERIIEHFMQDVGFDADGLGRSFRAFEYQRSEVIIEPAYRLGTPAVGKLRVPAETLVHAYRTEGSMEAAAEAYGVTANDVDAAYRYFDHLNALNAA